MNVSAIRRVVEASYDRLLIAEYQDCNGHQHELTIALSGIAPTMIFGDPMQGIFEFAGATLSWEPRDSSPVSGSRKTWKSPTAGATRTQRSVTGSQSARGRLIHGERIEFNGGLVAYRNADDAFDMEAQFESIDG